MSKYIAFIGDSFCADYNGFGPQLLLDASYMKWKNQGAHNAKYLCWPSILAERLDCKIANFGFGGASWWHSWQLFITFCWDNPSFAREQLETIVFCHTNPDRINSLHHVSSLPDQLDQYHSRGIEYYYRHLYDHSFGVWAQKQYFHEIKYLFSDIKTIHLFSLHIDPTDIPGFDQLPGIRFLNPLIWISVGELTGSESEIRFNIGAGETRINHLNEHNNRVLAEVLFQEIENYHVGNRTLDYDLFDIQNPNFREWPHGNFATK